MSKILFKVNVSTVIIKDGKFLLIRRADDEEVFPGMWGVTGGAVEPRDSSILRSLKLQIMLQGVRLSQGTLA